MEADYSKEEPNENKQSRTKGDYLPIAQMRLFQGVVPKCRKDKACRYNPTHFTTVNEIWKFLFKKWTEDEHIATHTTVVEFVPLGLTRFISIAQPARTC